MGENVENMENPASVPYVVYESAQARLESANKRLLAVVVLLIAVLVATNAAWLWYESQFEDVTITAEQTADGESNNYAVGGDYYGSTAESDNQKASP